MGLIFDPVETSRILVIDDSVDIHKLLERKLTDEGYEVVCAPSGPEGLEQARATRPSLILLDLRMPVMDGYEVLREIKEDSEIMHTPVIVLSGSEDSRDKVMGLELGAVDYICKPFDFAELRARVKSSIRLHRLMRLLSQRAQIDGLTGLWNRAYFDDRLMVEVNAARRSEQPLSLTMCDFDRFKEINDTYGHPAGDAVLEGFAKILNAELRSHDVACRYGGEEFALILRDTRPEEAMVVLERLRRRLELVVWPLHPERQVTASFGLAALEVDHDNAEALVAAADAALYQAKKEGRNRVVWRADGGARLAS